MSSYTFCSSYRLDCVYCELPIMIVRQLKFSVLIRLMLTKPVFKHRLETVLKTAG